MSKGKKKRRNQPRKMPPLSLLDKCIYWIAGVIAFGGLGVLFFRMMELGERLAFENEAVLAVSRHPSLAWMFPGFVSLGLTFCGLIVGNYGARQPIFGKPGVNGGHRRMGVVLAAGADETDARNLTRQVLDTLHITVD